MMKPKASIFLIFLCSLYSFLLITPIKAQEKDSTLRPHSDREAIAPKSPKAETLEALRSSRDYQYDTDPTPPQNPLSLLLSKLLNWLNKLLTAKSYTDFWQYVLLLGVTTAVLYLLYKAKMLSFLFPDKLKKEELVFASSQENIHELNFDTIIERALNHKDYRLAVRLLYLKTLKLFTDHHLIHWHPERTNLSYLEELTDSPFYHDFKKMTYFFEWTWYGNFKVEELEFNEMKDWATGFSKQLRS